jgi:hypothetical protein
LVWAFVYLALRRVLELLVLHGGSMKRCGLGCMSSRVSVPGGGI